MNSLIKSTKKIAQNPNIRYLYFITSTSFGGGLGFSKGFEFFFLNFDNDLNRKQFKSLKWYQKPSIFFLRGCVFISYVSIGTFIGTLSAAIIIPTLPIVVPLSCMFSVPILQHELKCIFGFK